MDPAFTSFVLGYHGCDQGVAEAVLSGKPLEPSENDYDWLGDGIYFWEHNAYRAYQFACEARERSLGKSQIRNPAVIGAVIDLALCLNLLDSRYIETVRRAYDSLRMLSSKTGTALPRNTLGADLLMRHLDCAVIRFLHESRGAPGELPFDTVRAVFVEGEPLYENSGFSAKNHIQICVRNLACIKGCFRPLDTQGRPLVFH